MAVQVEHEKRKHEILTKALELFIEEGYEDVTFQKIADRCGITRTTLYIYFKNKREIFLWSIKQFTQALEQEILTILKNPQYTSIECLECIFDMIITRAEENYQFFKVLLTYLIQLQKSGSNVNERVARRTIRIQHILSTIVIRGQKNGEIKKLPVKNINDQLYMLLECGIFRLAVLGKQKLDGIREMVAFSISQFREE
ncbi:TetR/AcrR family transcriptional regulator [Treponema peruense]|uniref:TetR/AcrR family transcriptional regulator n=1 Tax=Treponema peruense TaxID=2787628 RepID=A0A7T3RDI0_9SPIR|nr:TetR/AcrR family transcriptional regulator [Treponema peruense]QQA01035.1 TetR/AcrR family transcriptional regulator [Treponema peruense]